MKHLFTVLAVLPVCLTAGSAQDPAVVDSDHYQVVFENDQVRVLRITYGAGEESVMHDHPAGVAVALTPSSWTMTLPSGETVQLTMAAGEAAWAPAGPHLPRNDGEAAELILVEMKGDMEMEDMEREDG